MTAGNTLIIRAQEIIHQSKVRITDHDALKQAALELYKTTGELADALATATTGDLSKLRTSTYDVPEDDELTLFDVPALIAIKTDRGVLYVPRDDATLDEVRQWLDDGLSFHSAQRLRFKRMRHKVQAELKDVDGDTRWTEARMKLSRGRKTNEPKTDD